MVRLSRKSAAGSRGEARAPGFGWLLGHELRLLWRGSILVRTRRHVLAPMIAVGAVFQAIALALAWAAGRQPLDGPTLELIANLNLFFLFFLMLSRAMTAAIDVLYTRGDVDFLLASPIPPSRVLAVRMLGAAASTASPWLLLGGVMANALALCGHPAALAIYPMIGGVALVAAACAFALVVVLVGRVGPRVARTLSHTSALTVGVAIFALGQAPRYVPARLMARLWHGFLPNAGDAESPLFLPARAMLGQAWPLAASLAACALVFVLVLLTLDRQFATGAISAAATAAGGGRAARAGRFRAHPFGAAMLKNLRLLLRFPGLLTQTVYRSLTLVPVAMILSGRVRIGAAPGIVVPLLVFLAGQLALFFCSVIIASDQAPDLCRGAPVPAGLAPRASAAASFYATILIMALPLAGILLREGAVLPVAVAGIAGAAASNLALAQAFPIPLVRPAFGKTQKGNFLGLVLGVAVSSAWAGAAYLMVTPHPIGFLHG
jgi:ABC-2 type transport system permease protein